MPDMTPMSLAAAVAPRKMQINWKWPFVFLKEEKICLFKLSQSSEIVFQSWNLSSRKKGFSERGVALKGLRG